MIPALTTPSERVHPDGVGQANLVNKDRAIAV
jgi:hypothetical protein